MKQTKTIVMLLLAGMSICLLVKTANAQSSSSGGGEFIRNAGQITDAAGNAHPEILYASNGGGAELFIAQDKISYVFSSALDAPESDQNKVIRVDIQFLNTNPGVQVIGQNPIAGVLNYFLPSGAHSNVGSFQQIKFQNLYNNIDLVLNVANGNPVYDFVVRNGGNIHDIQFAFDGAVNVIMDNTGITAQTPFGNIALPVPTITNRLTSGLGIQIPTTYTRVGSTFSINTQGLTLSNNLDILLGVGIGISFDYSSLIQWTSFYGGGGSEHTTDVVTDAANNIYMVGYTESNTSFPGATGSKLVGNRGNGDAYVVMFNNGGARQFATVIGGSGYDFAKSIAVTSTSSSVQVFVTGGTASSNFFSLNKKGGAPAQTTKQTGGRFSAYVIQIDATNPSLPTFGAPIWSTYFGAGSTTSCYGTTIAFTGTNTLTIGGVLESTNGSISGFPYQNNLNTGALNNTSFLGGFSDGFLAQFGVGKCNLSWCTSLGTAGPDGVTSIAYDNSGNLFVHGYAGATGFPSVVPTGAYTQNYMPQSSSSFDPIDGIDATITKLDNQGVIQWSTYLGGSFGEAPYRAGIAASGSSFNSGLDIFNPSPVASATVPVTYAFLGVAFGPHSVDFDANNNVYITGTTRSADFPKTTGSVILAVNAYVCKFNNNGVSSYRSVFGGNNWITMGMGLSVDRTNNHLIITGSTNNDVDFPIQAASSSYNQGSFGNKAPFAPRGEYAGSDGFFAGFDLNGNRYWSTYFGGANTDICRAVSAKFGVTSFSGGTSTHIASVGDKNLPVAARAGAYNQLTNAGLSDGFIGTFSVNQITVKFFREGSFDNNEKSANDVIQTLHIQPNPVSDNLYIALPENAKGGVLELYNTLGQMVYSERIVEGNTTQTVGVNNLSKGIYMLRYTSGEETTTQRIVKE